MHKNNPLELIIFNKYYRRTCTLSTQTQSRLSGPSCSAIYRVTNYYVLYQTSSFVFVVAEIVAMLSSSNMKFFIIFRYICKFSLPLISSSHFSLLPNFITVSCFTFFDEPFLSSILFFAFCFILFSSLLELCVMRCTGDSSMETISFWR